MSLDFPRVVCDRSGTRAIELRGIQGPGKAPDRSAVVFRFAAASSPGGELAFIDVLISGTVRRVGVDLRSFGAWSFGSEVDDFAALAEARIGEFLDEQSPSDALTADKPIQLECFSYQLTEWEGRTRASDKEIEEYLRGRLYWSWHFDHEAVVFTVPDAVRLAAPPKSIGRIIRLSEGHHWEVQSNTGNEWTLRPLPELVRTMREELSTDTQRAPAVRPERVFVSHVRLQQLAALESKQFDFSRLIRLCEELNVAWGEGLLISVAALTRSLLDHVPPLFGQKSFAGVTSSYGGTKSFSESMRHLQHSARKIADAHLHTQIRSREVLPTETQVDFSRDLDVLLGEIVRNHQEP